MSEANPDPAAFLGQHIAAADARWRQADKHAVSADTPATARVAQALSDDAVEELGALVAALSHVRAATTHGAAVMVAAAIHTLSALEDRIGAIDGAGADDAEIKDAVRALYRLLYAALAQLRADGNLDPDALGLSALASPHHDPAAQWERLAAGKGYLEHGDGLRTDLQSGDTFDPAAGRIVPPGGRDHRTALAAE
jgi:hypothetical protein